MKRFLILGLILALVLMAGCARQETQQTPETTLAEPMVFVPGAYFEPAGLINEFVIISASDSQAVFSVQWPGESWDEVTAVYENGKAVFTFGETSGDLQIMDDGSLALTVGEQVYYLYYFGTEGNASDAMTGSVLTMSDAQQGWVLRGENGWICYICFRGDGIVDYWYGDSELTHVRDSYWVEESVLYMGQQEYDLYAFIDDTAIMNIAARGEFQPNLSGEYTVEADPDYQKLFAE